MMICHTLASSTKICANRYITVSTFGLASEASVLTRWPPTCSDEELKVPQLFLTVNAADLQRSLSSLSVSHPKRSATHFRSAQVCQEIRNTLAFVHPAEACTYTNLHKPAQRARDRLIINTSLFMVS